MFQDTGTFSMTPYVSFAQNFGRSSYGSFNFMDTLGYTFRIDSGRSNYFYNSAHLDYDVANLHKFYPMLELNWFAYTSSGNARAINQEGADLAKCGLNGSPTKVVRIFPPPTKTGGEKFDARRDFDGAIKKMMALMASKGVA